MGNETSIASCSRLHREQEVMTQVLRYSCRDTAIQFTLYEPSGACSRLRLGLGFLYDTSACAMLPPCMSISLNYTFPMHVMHSSRLNAAVWRADCRKLRHLNRVAAHNGKRLNILASAAVCVYPEQPASAHRQMLAHRIKL